MKLRTTMICALATCMLAGITAATAQDNTPPRAMVYVPGLMTGPGSFGPIGFRRLCDLRMTGLIEWRRDWIERLLKPADGQKAALDRLAAASSQARATVASACRRDRPSTSVAELALIDVRLKAVVQAFDAVKPAYEIFYATLDGRQKAKIDELGPHRRGWRW
jgi:hypothetical protein